MTSKQKTALDMIKAFPDHSGMSKEAITLHEKQCEDYEAMQRQINEIKTDITCVKNAQAELKEVQAETNRKIDNLTELVQQRSSFKSNLKEILNNKVFIYILVSLICAAFGVSIGEVGLELLK